MKQNIENKRCKFIPLHIALSDDGGRAPGRYRNYIHVQFQFDSLGFTRKCLLFPLMFLYLFVCASVLKYFSDTIKQVLHVGRY